MRFANTNPEFQWCWQLDYNSYMPYDAETNTAIETAFKEQKYEVEVVVSGSPYTVNFVYFC
jgi:hypothetical protein